MSAGGRVSTGDVDCVLGGTIFGLLRRAVGNGKMRALCMAAVVFAASIVAARAGDTISRQEAVDKARAAGFALISKTEPAPNAWDVWASKDGIPYEVRIDARSGAVVRETAVEADD